MLGKGACVATDSPTSGYSSAILYASSENAACAMQKSQIDAPVEKSGSSKQKRPCATLTESEGAKQHKRRQVQPPPASAAPMIQSSRAASDFLAETARVAQSARRKDQEQAVTGKQLQEQPRASSLQNTNHADVAALQKKLSGLQVLPSI